MKPTLHFHPLASFCWKPLIALYEREVDFEPLIVDLGDPASAAAFRAVWPMAKFPVLNDHRRENIVAESTVVIEYADLHLGRGAPMVPADPDLAWQARMWDRVLDSYVHEQMQKIVGDALRPADGKDPTGVALARAQLRQSYDLIEARMAGREWMCGDAFGLADCAASPALFYANVVEPFGSGLPAISAYLGRLMGRSSFARVLREAEPYFRMFPLDPKPTLAPPAG